MPLSLARSGGDTVIRQSPVSWENHSLTMQPVREPAHAIANSQATTMEIDEGRDWIGCYFLRVVYVQFYLQRTYAFIGDCRVVHGWY